MSDSVIVPSADIKDVPPTQAPQAITIQEFMEELRKIGELEKEGKLQEAENTIDALMTKVPNNASVIQTKAILAHKRRRYREGLRYMQLALNMEPMNPLFHRNAIEIFKHAGDMEQALNSGRKAVELMPYDFIANFNLGVIYKEMNRIGDSMMALESALECSPGSPDAIFCMSELNLMMGNYKEGWQQYEQRFSIGRAKGSLPVLECPLWNGEDVSGDKILLIIGDQGFGDCVQFGRYLPEFMQKYNCSPLLGISKELQFLFKNIPNTRGIIDNVKDVKMDYYVTLSSLPRYLEEGIRENSFSTGPINIPVDQEKVEKWAKNLSSIPDHRKLKVALCWAGRPTHANDAKRSMKLADFAPLLNCKDLSVISVQKDFPALQIQSYGKFECQFTDAGQALDTWEDTVALFSLVDVVVTVDTSVAHIAASMGKPVFMLCAFAPDWRWGLTANNTRWYSSMRIYRQLKVKDWSVPVAGVLHDLLAIIQANEAVPAVDTGTVALEGEILSPEKAV